MKIANCKKCGGLARVFYTYNDNNGWESDAWYPNEAGFVRCSVCGAKTEKHLTVTKAVEAWNRGAE